MNDVHKLPCTCLNIVYIVYYDHVVFIQTDIYCPYCTCRVTLHFHRRFGARRPHLQVVMYYLFDFRLINWL
jgi:hypothetical protein